MNKHFGIEWQLREDLEFFKSLFTEEALLEAEEALDDHVNKNNDFCEASAKKVKRLDWEFNLILDFLRFC